MPAPLPDLTRDQQCHYYAAPTGQRCGSPAIKGDYYCFHHNLKRAQRSQRRVLIDPELTRMEIPVVEDRTSIFVALAAVLHRLAENTIDTRRAGQMIYALQVCLQALPPVPAAQSQTAAQSAPANPPNDDQPTCQYVAHPDPEPESELEPGPIASGLATTTFAPANSARHPAANTQPSATPVTIPITRESLIYFLRSRHCAHCNAELFPADQLTYRRNPGAPPEVIEEAQPALPAPQPTATRPQPKITADRDAPLLVHSPSFPGAATHTSSVGGAL